jgi:pyridoxamine 5'-phosphate oxidase
MRNEYRLNTLSEKEVNKNPFYQFNHWFDDVLNLNLEEPNAVVLATADKLGKPSARVVLFKEVSEGGFIFYTNYNSKKGSDLEANPIASLLFFWQELERQVRIEGMVTKVDVQKSKKYFYSRPRESQIGAWASNQSEVIPDRDILAKSFKKYDEEFRGKDVPLPENWGGYKVVPRYFEFWQGRENRLHDRIAYKKTNSGWKIFRLSP